MAISLLPATDVQAEQTPSASPSPYSSTALASSGVQVPDFGAQAWVLADLDTGAVLASQAPHQKLRPASTFKLLTALTVLPQLAPEQLYRADIADENAEGSRVVLHKGLTYKVSDLLHAALLPSANDAAMALAKANGGASATVSQMRDEIARLGLRDTTVANPSGLDAPGQFTSAFDLASIGREALQNPEIVAALQLRTVGFPGKAKGQPKGKSTGDEPIDDENRVIYPIYNHNRMVINRYPGVIGGKSGYTSLARSTYVGGAERDGRRLVVSILKSEGNVYTTAARMLDWAFENEARLSPVDQLPTPAPAPATQRSATPLPQRAKAGDFGHGLLRSSAAEQPAAHAGEEAAGAAQDSASQLANSSAEPAQAAKTALATASVATAHASATAAAENNSRPAGFGWVSWLTVLFGLLAAARARVFWRSYRAGWGSSSAPSNTSPSPSSTSRAIRNRNSRPAPTIESIEVSELVSSR